MRGRLVALLALLLVACDPVVRRIVTLTFDPTGEKVTVSASTHLGDAKAGTREYAEVEEERASLLAERDEWSLRFGQALPESETVTQQRTRGKLESVERRATLAVDQLQKLFFDTPITITTTRGEGWSELNIYAGSSMRSTAAQRRQAERIMAAYSARAVRYFHAIDVMYSYLDEKPQRAAEMFTDVFSEDRDERPILSENERSITDDVRHAGAALFDTGDLDSTASVDRIFDLVYNPFPAQFKVAVKGQALAVEGFDRIDKETFEIKTPTAFEAVAALEGRWISPDPIALLYKTDDKKTAAELAAMIDTAPRHAATVVTASEVAGAIVEKMRPAPRYRLRWTTHSQG